MEITSAEFVISNTDVQEMPRRYISRICFHRTLQRRKIQPHQYADRKRKGLAMTSATPGKTMLINHFLINKSWYIVDLPGYGYAKRGQKGQEQIQTYYRKLYTATRTDDLSVCSYR